MSRGLYDPEPTVESVISEMVRVARRKQLETWELVLSGDIDSAVRRAAEAAGIQEILNTIKGERESYVEPQ